MREIHRHRHRTTHHTCSLCMWHRGVRELRLFNENTQLAATSCSHARVRERVRVHVRVCVVCVCTRMNGCARINASICQGSMAFFFRANEPWQKKCSKFVTRCHSILVALHGRSLLKKHLNLVGFFCKRDLIF